MDHRIVGFEITGDAVLEDSFLPFQDGLTAVYGLNGAGKSRLLRGIRYALLGEESDIGVFVVAQATPDAWESDRFPTSHPRYKTTGYRPTLRYAIAEQIGGWSPDVSFSNDRDRWIQGLSADQVTETVEEVFRSRLRSTNSELEEEIMQNLFFLLHPLGTSNAPRWEVWPAYDSQLPAAKAHLTRYEMLLAENNGNSTASQVLEFLDNGPILPPHLYPHPAYGKQYFHPTRFSPFDAYEGSDPDPMQGILLTPGARALDFGIDLVEESSDPNGASRELLKYIVEHAAEYSFDEIAYQAGTSWGERVGLPPTTMTRIARTVHITEESTRFYQSSGMKTAVDIAAAHTGTLISQRAQQYFGSVLQDAPVPVLRLAAAEERFTRPGAAWEFDTDDSERAGNETRTFPALGLNEMSGAEQKWLRLAIADALYWTRREIERGEVPRPALTLIDEPEAALHRSAESTMATALTKLVASDPRRVMIVATHSPELLDHPRANLIEIKRNNGPLSDDDRSVGAKRARSIVQPLELKDKDSLQALGLNPSDLLRWTKVFLLVEGHHEKLIFDELFSARLQKARVEVITLDGAKNLKGTADSYILFKYTRAHVVALVDNLQHQSIQNAWAKARELRSTRSQKDAVDHLNVVLKSPSGKKAQDEIGFIRGWLIKALENGVDSRLSPHGLGEKDILNYLPVEAFLPRATSWNELWEQHAEARKTRDNTPRSFKDWLVSQSNSRPLTNDTILKAVAKLTSIPKEFEQLMKRLEALSSEV